MGPAVVLGAALPVTALAQLIDQPSDREYGQERRDDHAHAHEHISEDHGGAGVDAHGGPSLEPLLVNGERRLIAGGYRNTVRWRSGNSVEWTTSSRAL